MARSKAEHEALSVAAFMHVHRLVPEADQMVAGVYPAWHGWAIRDAFVAGADFQRERDASKIPDKKA